MMLLVIVVVIVFAKPDCPDFLLLLFPRACELCVFSKNIISGRAI